MYTFRNTDNSANTLKMEENQAYETKAALQRQAHENTSDSEPTYEIIPAVSSQPPQMNIQQYNVRRERDEYSD